MNLSGRGFIRKKDLIDDVLSLDILWPQRKDVFESGPYVHHTSSWKRGNKTISSIGYSLVEDGNDRPIGLRFMYTTTNRSTGSKKELDYIVSVESTPCNYGGERWWFICPLKAVNSCVYRCRILYSVSEYFGCRECCVLTYRCRHKHRNSSYEGYGKQLDKIAKAEKVLDSSRSLRKRIKAFREIEMRWAIIQNYIDNMYARLDKNKSNQS